MENRRSHVSGYSAIGATAALSVVVLLGTVGWQTYRSFYPAAAPSQIAEASANPAPGNILPTTSTVGSSVIGAAVLEDLVSRYTKLQEAGKYSPEAGQRVAEEMASTLIPEVPFTHHVAADITTDSVTSADRALAYRRDLQESLAPLLKNTQAEFEIFAYYTDTKDAKYLIQLKEVAANYRAAAQATAKVVVPKDAVEAHIGILNALAQFAATLDAQVANVRDPLASVALLRSYNEAEAGVLSSFNTLATYFRQKST